MAGVVEFKMRRSPRSSGYCPDFSVTPAASVLGKADGPIFSAGLRSASRPSSYQAPNGLESSASEKNGSATRQPRRPTRATSPLNPSWRRARLTSRAVADGMP